MHGINRVRVVRVELQFLPDTTLYHGEARTPVVRSEEAFIAANEDLLGICRMQYDIPDAVFQRLERNITDIALRKASVQ